jgi:small-conductance mechanosensitive channel
MNFLESFLEAIDVDRVETLLLRSAAAVLILLVGVWLAKVPVRSFLQRIRNHDSGEEESITLYRNIAHLLILVVAISLALHTLGVDLTHVFTTGGLLALAAAFALKTVADNFAAGLIVRMEDSIKRGDVLSLRNGEVVVVEKIGPRATVVRSKLEACLIVPNSLLVQDFVPNLTYHDSLCRIHTTVGVAYSSDLDQVRSVLEEACAGVDWLPKHTTPKILLDEFGDSSVNYKILMWTDDPWNRDRYRSDLNERIWRALSEAGIVIAFPQIDVHLDREGTAPNPANSQQT